MMIFVVFPPRDHKRIHSTTMISKAEKAYTLGSLELGQRLDGRGMEEYRAIKVERIGESVRVWIGGTSVVGRVRMEVEDGNGRVTSRVQW